MAVAGTLEYLISIDSSKVSSGLNAAEGKVKGFGDKLSSWAVAKGQVLGNLISKAGQGTVQFVKSAIDESKTFDKSMSQVAATLGKSTKEIQNLSKFAREMGSKTAFTATEAAQGLNYMALAGYDAETSMRMLPTVLNLAAAGNMELASASDMVTDAQSALGLSIEETETMVDQMAKTSSKTNTSVEQLGSAFLTVGGTAKKLKGGTAELSALLGVLANNGIKGAEGGTALRNVLNALSNPAGKAAKQLKKLKIDAYDKEGNLRSMTDILSEFGEKTKDMSDKQRTDLFAKMFNIRDLKSIEALLSMTKDDWDKLTEEIEESQGAADKMAKTQLDNLAGDMTIFGSALSEAKLALVEGLTPALRSLVKSGTYWLSDLTKNFKEKGFKGITETAEKAWKFLERKWTIRSKNPFARFVGYSMKALRTGFKWNDIKNALTNGWKVVTDGFNKLGELVFGKKVDGTINWPTWETLKTTMEEGWRIVTDAFKVLGEIAFGTKVDGTINWPSWEDIKKAMDDGWKIVTDAFKVLGEVAFGTKVDGSINWPTWSSLKETLESGWKIVTDAFNGLLGIDFSTLVTEGNIPNIPAIFETISTKWKEMRQTIIDNAINIATYFFDTSDPDTIATAIKTIADAMEAIGVAILTYELVTSLPKVFNTIRSLFTMDLGSGSKIGLILAGIAAAITLIYEHWDEIKPALEEIGSWLNDNVLTPINEFIDGLKDAIKKIAEFFGIDTSGWFGGNRPQPQPQEGNKQQGLHGAPIDKEQADSLTRFRNNYLNNKDGYGVNASGKTVPLKDVYEEIFKDTLRNNGFEEPAIDSMYKKSLEGNKQFAEVLTDLSNASMANAKQFDDSSTQIGDSSDELKEDFKVLSGAAETAAEALGNLGQYNNPNGNKGEKDQPEDKKEKDEQENKTGAWKENAPADGLFELKGSGKPRGRTKSINEQRGIDENAAIADGGYDTDVLLQPDGSELDSYVAGLSFTAPVTLVPQGGADNSYLGTKPPGTAKGSWNIPYDNYLTRLHRGEMVLTKSQARQYREGSSGNADISGMAASIVAAVREGMAGAQVNSFLSGKKVTDDSNRRTSNMLRARRFATT